MNQKSIKASCSRSVRIRVSRNKCRHFFLFLGGVLPAGWEFRMQKKLQSRCPVVPRILVVGTV